MSGAIGAAPRSHHRNNPALRGEGSAHLEGVGEELLAVQPDVVVGAALGGQQVGQVVGQGLCG